MCGAARRSTGATRRRRGAGRRRTGASGAAARKHRVETVGITWSQACELMSCVCCEGWQGSARRGRAGLGLLAWGGDRVVEELRTPCGRSKMLITNRLYSSMCGSRASEPSSRSRVNLHDTRTHGGYWRERARRSLWLVVKSCAWELPARALVPLSGSCPHACSSAQHAYFNGCRAARIGHRAGLAGRRRMGHEV